jgi:hypothetical protein
MDKWELRKGWPYDKKDVVVGHEGRRVAVFEHDADAARCVEAVNEEGRLREALNKACYFIEETIDYSLFRHEDTHEDAVTLLKNLKTTLEKEES